MDHSDSNLFVRMEDITKEFPGVKALDHCRFELRAGEMHALLGENGAGKSTLMKVLTGIYKKDSGRIWYFGEEREVHSTIDSKKTGDHYDPSGAESDSPSDGGSEYIYRQGDPQRKIPVPG